MDAIELAHGTTELLPPIGAVIAYNHRALEVLRYDERDGGWIAGGVDASPERPAIRAHGGTKPMNPPSANHHHQRRRAGSPWRVPMAITRPRKARR